MSAPWVLVELVPAVWAYAKPPETTTSAVAIISLSNFVFFLLSCVLMFAASLPIASNNKGEAMFQRLCFLTSILRC